MSKKWGARLGVMGAVLAVLAMVGCGGVMNVRRTVQAYERAGVAARQIEDQSWPKRCGHLSGKTLIPAEEMVAKVKAACDARRDADFVIIARTDALAVEGFERALERGKLYEEAGADVVFIESPTTMAQLQAIPRAFKVPTLYNMACSGKTPFLPLSRTQPTLRRRNLCVLPAARPTRCATSPWNPASPSMQRVVA